MASDTRHRLVRTTGRLLREQGYAASGLNQIVAEAEAPKGSLYFHFPGGKEELAAAAVDRFAERVTAHMTDELARRPAAEAIAGFFDGYVRHMAATDFREGCAVATVALDAASSHELLAEATGRAIRTWVGLLGDALVAEGHNPDDAHRVATLVIAAIEGTIVMAKGTRSTEPFVAARDALAPLLTAPLRS